MSKHTGLKLDNKIIRESYQIKYAIINYLSVKGNTKRKLIKLIKNNTDGRNN